MKNREVCKVGRRLFLSLGGTICNEDDFLVRKGLVTDQKYRVA
jgi:hypothetical protein